MMDFKISVENNLLFNIRNKKVVKLMKDNWEQFIYNGIESESVRGTIFRSWLRCRKNNLDPYKGLNNNILPEHEVKNRYDNVKEMLDVAKPFMKSLYTLVKGSGYVVMFHDKDGILLEQFGDPDMMRYIESLNVVHGATCKESIVGTTAPGICLIERNPTLVYFKEHYCINYHQWTSSASPIFDTEGTLFGTLNLAGKYYRTHIHTLGLVVAAAKAIERELSLKAVKSKFKKTNLYIDAIINSVSEGVISFNEDGVINHINQVGANMLGLSLDECVGAPINRLFNDVNLINTLSEMFEKTRNNKLTLQTQNGKIKVDTTFKVVRDDEGTITYIGTFNKIDKYEINVKNRALNAKYTFDDIVFVSKKIRNLVEYAQNVCLNDSTVLIEGESGTGKELFVQAIHNYSIRKTKPFIVLNCAALPKDLIHSELFGYEGGSFTGAYKSGKQGKFEQANGGTIFLDEIGDMPIEVQANLLRVLQEKEFMRIGGEQSISLDVRVIAATNKQLQNEIKKGNFRQDLFYRLNIIHINLPPLRERPEDILPLTRFLLQKHCRRNNCSVPSIAPEVENIFLSYYWPGNVRELENVIIKILFSLKTDTITTNNLPDELLNSTKNIKVVSLEDLEKNAIIKALDCFDFNISKAAKGLGITRASLYNKIKKYNIMVE